MTVQLIQICPSLQLLQSFFQNIALKGYLTQRWLAITVSILQKNLTKCRPLATKKCQIFTLIYHWNFPKGRCMTFQGRCKNYQGRCKTISGEVRTSPHNPALFKFWDITLICIYTKIIYLEYRDVDWIMFKAQWSWLTNYNIFQIVHLFINCLCFYSFPFTFHFSIPYFSCYASILSNLVVRNLHESRLCSATFGTFNR